MSAFVQRPAPTFTAEAVIEGTFASVSLQDYLGQWYVPWLAIMSCLLIGTQGCSPFLSNVGLCLFASIATCHKNTTGTSPSFVQRA